MSFTGAQGGGVDLLTRTTLQMDRATPAASIATFIRRLQSVPGVLLAESTAGSALAVVSHDAGVAESSLLEAARSVGVRAEVAREPARAALAARTAPASGSALLRHRVAMSMAAFATLLLADTVVPTDKHWIVALLVLALGVFLFVQAVAAGRRA